MTRRNLVEGLFAVVSIPACAGIAAGVYLAADSVFGMVVSPSSPMLVLVSGLFGMWAVVLFGMLLEQAERLTSHFFPQAIEEFIGHRQPGADVPCPRHD